MVQVWWVWGVASVSFSDLEGIWVVLRCWRPSASRQDLLAYKWLMCSLLIPLNKAGFTCFLCESSPQTNWPPGHGPREQWVLPDGEEDAAEEQGSCSGSEPEQLPAAHPQHPPGRGRRSAGGDDRWGPVCWPCSQDCAGPVLKPWNTEIHLSSHQEVLSLCKKYMMTFRENITDKNDLIPAVTILIELIYSEWGGVFGRHHLWKPHIKYLTIKIIKLIALLCKVSVFEW